MEPRSTYRNEGVKYNIAIAMLRVLLNVKLATPGLRFHGS